MSDPILEKLPYDLAVAILGGGLGWEGLKWAWPYLLDMVGRESARQARQVSGRWLATEVFSGTTPHTTDEFDMEIECRGGRVSGRYSCTAGPDKGKKFTIRGAYKDQILTFVWSKDDHRAIESGTVTAKFAETPTGAALQGHGLYIEPGDGKVYTSTFSAVPA